MKDIDKIFLLLLFKEEFFFELRFFKKMAFARYSIVNVVVKTVIYVFIKLTANILCTPLFNIWKYQNASLIRIHGVIRNNDIMDILIF